MGASHLSGALIETGLRNSQDTARSEGSVRDLQIFLPPFWFFGANGTWTRTYDATNGSEHLALTATATDLDPGLTVLFHAGMFVSTETADAQRIEAARGPRINSIDFIYGVGTNTLDNFVVTLDTILYNDVAAPTVTNRPISNTNLVLTVTADLDNPSKSNLAVTTPFVLSSGVIARMNTRINGPAGTSSFRLYGAFINYDLLI